MTANPPPVKRPRSWLKWGVKWGGVIALLLVVVVLALLVAARRSPPWYAETLITLSDPAAKTAEDQFINLRNWSASVLAARNRREPPPAPFVIDLTSQEINSILFRWLGENGWDSKLSQDAGFTAPAVRLEPQRLTLAARPVQADWLTATVSLSAAVINGQLLVSAGTPAVGAVPLPLPQTLTVGQLTPALTAARQRYAAKALLNPKGYFNQEAATALALDLALAGLAGKPTPATVLLPVDGRRCVPADITTLEITPGRIRLTLTARPASQDAELLKRLTVR